MCIICCSLASLHYIYRTNLEMREEYHWIILRLQNTALLIYMLEVRETDDWTLYKV